MATANTNLSNYDKSALPDASSFKLGIVVSEWNAEVTNGLLQGALKTLLDCGVLDYNISVHKVPGSFELIYGCKVAMNAGFDAVIALGSVIRGETAHFDYVCEAVASGIKDLNLQGKLPVIFGVLTDDTLAQAQARSGGKLGNKGAEAAVAAIKMATLAI